MRPKAAQGWLGRPWFTALLFAALASRALIPVGFMPGAGGIVLCDGYAPVLAMSGTDMAGMDMSGKRHGVDFCPYTAVASAMAAGHAPTLTVLTQVVASVIVLPAEKPVPRGTVVPTSLPRGPPASV